MIGRGGDDLARREGEDRAVWLVRAVCGGCMLWYVVDVSEKGWYFETV